MGDPSDSQKYKQDSTVREEEDSKPVILVFTGNYLPGYKAGGILRNLINTVDFLCDTFEFKIVTRDRDLGDSVRYPEIEVDNWQLVGNAQVYYLSQGSETLDGIYKLIKETPHHVVFLTSYFDPLTIKALINRKIRLHDCRPVIVAPFGEFAWASLSQKYVKKLIFISLARLFSLHKNVVWRVSSSYEAEDLVRVIKPKKGLIRIVGDLPIKIVSEMTASSSAPAAQPETGVLKIVFLSRIAREKNLNIALMILQKVQVPVLFDIYGPAENTSYWNECQELIANLPDNVVVKYCGNVHPSKVLEIFGLYDLFLFPTGGEAYGNVIAESLIAGTSVLVSTMTPWRNLEPDGLGWDIELSNIDAFVEVIESVSRQSASQRLQIRNDVKKRVLERLFDVDVLESNHRLFSNPDQ